MRLIPWPSVVDCREREPAWRATLSPPPVHIVIEAPDGMEPSAADGIDGWFRGIPVVVLASGEPFETIKGAIGVKPQPTRALAIVRAEQKTTVRDQAWAYVEEHIDTREREALSVLLQKVTLMRGMGMDPDEGATLALLATLQWAEDVLASYAPLSAAIDDAETFADIMAVTFDPSHFAPPPTVSATEIALALRGGA